MSNFEIKFIIDGKEVSQEKIHEVERERYQVAFNEFIEVGAKPIYKGKELSQDEIKNISLDEAKEALAETKESIGYEGILELFKDKLEASDNMWREIAKNSPDNKDYQVCIVEVEARGIGVQQFAMYNQYIEKQGGLALPSKIHPEHYLFEAFPGGQIVMETFGMYKNPTYMKLGMLDASHAPAKIDEDTQMTMLGSVHLMSDGTDTKIIGMHQFKHLEGGAKIKLGVYLPKAAPKEILEGHKYHLAVEFNNVFHYANEMFNK